MQMDTTYVPILKGKEGEFSALEAIPRGLMQELTPVIEIPAVPYDYSNKRPAKTVTDHLGSFPERINKCCPDSQIYVDLMRFAEHGSPTSDFEPLLNSYADNYRPPMFVVSTKSSEQWLRSIRS